MASLTSSSIIIALSEYNILHALSITYDNSCEFPKHEDRFLPKRTNFNNITDEEIKIIENWINNRSMKVLDWKSSNKMFKSVALSSRI